MKLSVKSDGTPKGTVVTDTQTGQVLDNVVNIRFAISKYIPQATAEVTLYVPITQVELEALFEETAWREGQLPSI